MTKKCKMRNLKQEVMNMLYYKLCKHYFKILPENIGGQNKYVSICKERTEKRETNYSKESWHGISNS